MLNLFNVCVKQISNINKHFHSFKQSTRTNAGKKWIFISWNFPIGVCGRLRLHYFVCENSLSLKLKLEKWEILLNCDETGFYGKCFVSHNKNKLIKKVSIWWVFCLSWKLCETDKLDGRKARGKRTKNHLKIDGMWMASHFNKLPPYFFSLVSNIVHHLPRTFEWKNSR